MTDQKQQERLLELSSVAAGYSKTIPYFTERRYLEDGVNFIITSDTHEEISWLQITKVGKPIEKNPEYFLTALQKVLYSCSFPNQKVLFLITGGDCAENGVFVGIENTNASEKVKTLSKFISSVWPGTELKEVNQDTSSTMQELTEALENEDIIKIGAVTGVPSMKTLYETIYPATIDHLIESMGDCGKYAYLVVTKPISNGELEDILYKLRDLQGQVESLKSIQIANNEGGSISITDTENVSLSYKEVDTGKLSERLKKISPTLSFEKKTLDKVVGRSLACIPFFGNAVPNESIGGSRSFANSFQWGKTITHNMVNKHIEAISEHLAVYAERFESGKAVGMWNVSSFLMTSGETDFKKGESLLKSLLSGQESKYEPIRIRDISSDMLDYATKDKENKTNIINFRFPKVGVNDISHPFGKLYDCLSTPLTTKELTSFINFPLKSVQGITVREQASFGRNIVTHSEEKRKKSLRLGSIMHLGECIENQNVEMDLDALSSHMFITGTTGSGKSNTLYLMLDQIRREGKKFLVIEPAKGEYKNIFGCKDVRVVSGNPNTTELLRINPFMFPKGIHVYEHIDAITEIFNACWPMSAAMPVVLKHSIEEAYKGCGWNLNTNTNTYGLWPTMKDVFMCLNKMINDSKFSNDTKGDYIGALETRLLSMSEGLVGQMFNSSSPLGDEELFNHNVIIDLSRVRSSETKSLIMGMVILKLQEWRTAENLGMNLPLRHVTILEEAHHLLKRTSTQQTMEGANLVGKSVEMIVNGIAEMRTYGEGFIIADQSPSLLDLSVIRNTNTKVIMALPEVEDREIVGRSVGLTPEQINELSKQKRGEAVVYQNDWEEAVQCKIDLFGKSIFCKNCPAGDGYTPDEHVNNVEKTDIDVIKFLLDGRLRVKPKYDIEKVRKSVNAFHGSSALKYKILRAIEEHESLGYTNLWNDSSFVELSSLVAEYVGKEEETEKLMKNEKSSEKLTVRMKDLCKKVFNCETTDSIESVLAQCMLRHQAEVNPKLADKYIEWFEFNKRG